jgi:hypothetical protein
VRSVRASTQQGLSPDRWGRSTPRGRRPVRPLPISVKAQLHFSTGELLEAVGLEPPRALTVQQLLRDVLRESERTARTSTPRSTRPAPEPPTPELVDFLEKWGGVQVNEWQKRVIEAVLADPQGLSLRWHRAQVLPARSGGRSLVQAVLSQLHRLPQRSVASAARLLADSPAVTSATGLRSTASKSAIERFARQRGPTSACRGVSRKSSSVASAAAPPSPPSELRQEPLEPGRMRLHWQPGIPG